MAINSKLKKVFESLNDNDEKTARALFHEAVVEAAREIYAQMESEELDFEDDVILDPEFDTEEWDLSDFDFDETIEEDSEDVTLDFEADLDGDVSADIEEIESEEEGEDLEIDAADDLEMELDNDDDLEVRISNIEDAFEELKAEFEEINADEDDMDDELDADEAEDIAISDLDAEEDLLGESLTMSKVTKPAVTLVKERSALKQAAPASSDAKPLSSKQAEAQVNKPKVGRLGPDASKTELKKVSK